jgi:hypothetical protein
MKRKMVKRRREKKFNAILLKAVDEALLTLGENAKLSLYFHLETKFSISKKDIPDRISDFSYALEQIFGLAARHLEILIMKCLNEKINCKYEWAGPKWLVPDLTFAKYVKLLELWCEDTEKTWELEVTLDAGEQQERQSQ